MFSSYDSVPKIIMPLDVTYYSNIYVCVPESRLCNLPEKESFSVISVPGPVGPFLFSLLT